ncbi:MAG: sugar transferase [Candidatus Uhrbacteria bacterium]
MKRSEIFFTVLRLPLDYLALVAAGTAAYYSRFLPQLTDIRPVTFDLTIEQYTNIILFIALVWVVVFALSGLYSTTRQKLADEISRIVIACAVSVAVVVAILFFTRQAFESRYILLAAWFLATVFVGSERIVIRGIQRSIKRFGVGIHRVVIIGKGRASEALKQEFAKKPRLGFVVVAEFDTFDDEVAKQIKKLRQKTGVDEIIFAKPEATRQDREDLLTFADAEHITFKHTADIFAAASTRFEAHTIAGIPIIELKATPLDGWGSVYKHIFDIVGSLFLIILTLPIQIVVAIALFIEQPGRIFFSREPNGKKTKRIGKNGKPFHYFKFRSMIKDAHKYRFDPEFVKKHGNEREKGPLFKLKDDPRVTKVGKFIRKFSLDELPEFYLVFIGRMSLVGPRPHLPEEVQSYSLQHRRVHTIKPGITGLAQISGRADLDFEEEVRLDVYYIENWSPWRDIYILFKTPIIVLFRKGAY